MVGMAGSMTVAGTVAVGPLSGRAVTLTALGGLVRVSVFRLEVVVGRALSREEIAALPVTVDVVTACRALGLGRTLGYELVRRGEFPVRVLRVGRRYLVPTAELRTLLGIPSGPAAPEAS